MTSDAVVPPSVHAQKPDVPGLSSVQAVRGSTTESHSRSYPPSQHAKKQPQLPAEPQPPFSQPHQRLSGLPGRQRYFHEGPQPLVNADGQARWIVNYIVGHDKPHREATVDGSLETCAAPYARKYRIRWLGFPPDQDTWEPRSSLPREIPDVFRAYELMESSYPDTPANDNALVVNESDKAIHDVAKGNDVEVKNVVVTGYHHDRENETLLRGARRVG